MCICKKNIKTKNIVFSKTGMEWTKDTACKCLFEPFTVVLLGANLVLYYHLVSP